MATVVSYSYMSRNVTYYARPQRIVKDCMKTRGLNNNIDFLLKHSLKLEASSWAERKIKMSVLHYLGCRSEQF